ncbi:Transcription factor TFIIIB component B [Actinomortierella ambigua]|uniref:Transcription factor TFIIIB component B n=1 Tax=Actinomortierella ambigua TaxID=1343610 RepID=A0A9P6QM98_9FUNG|nr:Transcription factor TFIIIB component B [Actinomortierella ambigua]
MSLTSSRVDKGTTRFAPKLKARPTRKQTGAPSASDESTPTPSTPSTIDQSAASSTTFASTAAFDNQSNGSTTPTATGTPAGTPTVTPSTQVAPLPLATSSSSSTSSPIVPVTFPHIGPKSPTFSPARLKDRVPSIASSSSSAAISAANTSPSTLSKSSTPLPLSSPSSGVPVVAPSSTSSSAGTAISIPGSNSKRNSSTGTAIDTPTSSNSRKAGTSTNTKQASLISVPTSRPRHSHAGDQNEDTGAASPSTPTTPGGGASKRRASVQRSSDRGKKVARRKQEEGGDQEGDGYGGEGGEEGGLVDEEDEDFVPDYSDTPMFEFVRDMGAGRRSAMFVEKERLWDQQREREREARKRREAGLEEALDNRGRFMKEPTPKPQTPRSFGPKVRVVDGKMVLDEDSLQIDHSELEAPQDEGPMEYVEESASTTYINSTSYSNKNRGEKWTPRETDLFYEALSQWGTDFGIIHKMFPSKSRIAVRNKFKREDRINKARVEAALTNKTPIDLEQYSKMTAYTFSDMTEEEILGNIQKEEEEKAKMLIKSEEQLDEQEPEPEPEPEPEEEIVEEIVGTI